MNVQQNNKSLLSPLLLQVQHFFFGNTFFFCKILFNIHHTRISQCFVSLLLHFLKRLTKSTKRYNYYFLFVCIMKPANYFTVILSFFFNVPTTNIVKYKNLKRMFLWMGVIAHHQFVFKRNDNILMMMIIRNKYHFTVKCKINEKKIIARNCI